MDKYPINEFLSILFSCRPQEEVNKWAQYLFKRRFRIVADIRNLSDDAWRNMDPDIPSHVSEIIKSSVRKIKQGTQQGFLIQRNLGLFSPNERGQFETKKTSDLSPSFQTLSDNIKNDAEFMKVRLEIESMKQLEEIEKVLQEYMGRSMAKTLAADLFRELKKDTIVLEPIDIFETNLRKLEVPPKDICDIRYLIEKGKKLTVRNKLIECLGSIKGQVQYKALEKIIVEKVSEPIEGSKFIKQKNDLRLFQHNQRLLEQEKASAKNLIVFGETGCGKSTFLNAIVNYVAGVEMEDTFRYIVVVENDVRQLQSLTRTINDYYIKDSRTGIVYRLIDTPGFGDTRGVQKDEQLVKQVERKFKKDIECIHAVLFVMKASTNRVTAFQRYVFHSVMDLFDKEIAKNFAFIFTFSDSGKPQVLEYVMDTQNGFGKYWNDLIEPKYIEVNNCGFFSKIDEGDRLKKDYWKIGVKCLDKLFQKIDTIEPKSLQLTNQMIKTKRMLNNQIIHTTATIQQAISKRQNIKAHIQMIVLHRDKINNNKNFTYQVQEDQWYTETTTKNVTRCNNAHCFSELNCHIGCEQCDGQGKQKCIAMDKTTRNCTICGCNYTAHANSKIIRKVRQVIRTKINQSKRLNCILLELQMKLSEFIIKEKLQQLEIQMQKIIEATKEIAILQNRLLDIQMSDKKPESMKAYLQYLIQNENIEKAPNYLKRIQGYQEVIKQIQVHERIKQGQGNNEFKKIVMQLKEQGEGNNDVKKILMQLKEANAQNIIDSVQPGLFQKIKKFILN